jgi:hypothetical protein
MAVNRKQAPAIAPAIGTPALLTTAMQTLYAVPSGMGAKDITFDFQNTDPNSAVGVTLHLVPSGGSATATNKLFSETGPNGMVISPQEWRSVPIDQAIGAGATIQAKASIAGVVNIHITVSEVS